jgi:Tfp pilus assembly protein PilO
MSSSRKHLALAMLAGFLVFALGFGVLVWPSLSRASEIDDRIAELAHKNKTLDSRTDLVAQLTQEVADAEARAGKMLKRIPDAEEVADVMKQLSMPVDGYYVADQSFTTGQSRRAATDENITARAIPITVDLVARYEALLELIRRAEASERLVRIASVRVHRHPDRSNLESDDDALLIASITIDAIYQPRMVGGARP